MEAIGISLRQKLALTSSLEIVPMAYQAVPARKRSNGWRAHMGKSKNVRTLLKAANAASRFANVTPFTMWRTLMSLQKAWMKETERANTRKACTRKAKAVPMAILACCLEIENPQIVTSDTLRPARLW